MKKFESGRTLIETLAVIAIIGILSISGLQLYAKSMNTIRANYIMEQLYIKATEQVKNPVANRHKTADVSMQSGNNLAYGYSFDSVTNNSGRSYTIKINGYFTDGVKKIIQKRLNSGSSEYAWINQSGTSLGTDQLTFSVSFNKKKKIVKRNTSQQTGQVESPVNSKNQNENDGPNANNRCTVEHAISCDPLICDEDNGWYEFEDEPGKCQRCPAGYFCE